MEVRRFSCSHVHWAGGGIKCLISDWPLRNQRSLSTPSRHSPCECRAIVSGLYSYKG